MHKLSELQLTSFFVTGSKSRWATRHRSDLEKRSSTLEFKLHRQRYLQLLMDRQVQEAIAYARKNFAYFGNRHTQGNCPSH